MNTHKFYITRWKPKVENGDDRILVKFGHTHHTDVTKRFDPDVDDGYPVKFKQLLHDHLIFDGVMYSSPKMSKKKAQQIENTMLWDRFPYHSKYKVWLESWLGLKEETALNDTGVTEFRLLEKDELYFADGLIAELKATWTKKEALGKAHARKKYGKHTNT